MRVRYHWIQGKKVRTSDGRRIGRITDLVAEAQGDSLYVTALLVGPGGLVRRLSFTRRRFLRAVRAMQVPWRLVGDIGDEVSLLVDYEQLCAVCDEERGAGVEHEPEEQERPA